ncbi:alpha/beta hydrolase-fold protein [Actinomadura oligospora]|uniref:alpha/beta hydrolase-fold protein n=1 Tax=Actinomadura oligospora TaxID=111804 RepID=UPI0004AF22DA|nr:alpha/beta hydrolase-fold protein [Actinomadura oligospora]
MRARLAGALCAVLLVVTGTTAAGVSGHGRLRFAVTLSPSAARQAGRAAVDGRAYVIVSRKGDSEPRDQIDITGGVPFWGRNVDGVRPGGTVVLDAGGGTYGYPLKSIASLPAGRYSVQAFFNTYDTFRRGDGSTVKMHMPCGDGMDLFDSPGNFSSSPRWVDIDPAHGGTVDLTLDHLITPSQPVPAGGTCQQGNPADSAHVKHVKIQSPALSRFWGRPIYIGANILLPAGYDPDGSVRYPVEYHFGHFTTNAPRGFREDGGNAFSKWWLSDAAPRFIVVELREENPFYDTSYAVDTPNLGPYGQATTRELIPAIDARFRTIAEPYGRLTSGGSTGGWMALAGQVFYPDVYGGAFAGYPDPVDLRREQIVNVYGDGNAYETVREWDRTPRPDSRNVAGDTNYVNAQENLWELARGDKDRSGGSWAMWEALFSPRGKDGYPALAWDKASGTIDHSVSAGWTAMDLSAKVAAEWPTLGPKLQGKVFVYVGDTDTYFLNTAVELFQQRTDALANPSSGFAFVYGRAKQHGWSPYTAQEWFQIYADHVARHAPKGTDVAAWRGPRATPRLSASGGVIVPPEKHVGLPR